MEVMIEYHDHTAEAFGDVKRAVFRDYKISIMFNDGTKVNVNVFDKENELTIKQCFAGHRLLFNFVEFNNFNDDVEFKKMVEENMEEWRGR